MNKKIIKQENICGTSFCSQIREVESLKKFSEILTLIYSWTFELFSVQQTNQQRPYILSEMKHLGLYDRRSKTFVFIL